MRVVVVTSGVQGTAALCVSELVKDPAITVAMIVCSKGAITNTWKHGKRKLEKVLRVGVLGVMNGRRMGPWFNAHVNERLHVDSLDVLAKRYRIPFQYTPTLNSDKTIELLRAARADLGLALGGNPYIGEQVYSVPRYGMINIHAEVLPEFQGALPVVWQIHEGSPNTGYTIHRIDKHIDTGAILYKEVIPIEFQRTFPETITHNCVRIAQATSKALPYVVKNYPQLAANSTPQPRGRFYTTPTFGQYLTMLKQHEALSSQHAVRHCRHR